MKFKKNIVLFFLFVLISCNNKESLNKNHIHIPIKGSNDSDSMKANIKFFKTDLDFGILKKGEIVSKYITFKNDGNRDLIISNVKSSCGCTITNWPQNPIPPNSHDTIYFQLNTESLNGKILKTVTIISNSLPNTKVIKINAQIN